MTFDFKQSSGVMTIFKRGITNQIGIFGNYFVKVTSNVLEVPVSFHVRKDYLIKVFDDFIIKASHVTASTPAARTVVGMFQSEARIKKCSTYRIYAEALVNSLISIMHYAKESVDDISIVDRFVNSGPMPKFALWIFQFIRLSSRQLNIPVSDISVRFRLGEIEPEPGPNRIPLEDAILNFRLLSEIARGGKDCLLHVNHSHVNNTVPGFFTFYVLRNDSVTGEEVGQTKAINLVLNHRSTSFDQSMAFILGLSSSFVPDHNVSDAIMVQTNANEMETCIRNMLSEFLVHIFKVENLTEVTVSDYEIQSMPFNEYVRKILKLPYDNSLVFIENAIAERGTTPNNTE